MGQHDTLYSVLLLAATGLGKLALHLIDRYEDRKDVKQKADLERLANAETWARENSDSPAGNHDERRHHPHVHKE